jgi:hypothetical protein
MIDDRAFATLEGFFKRMPAIEESIGKGHFDDGGWWVKFSIDISHPLAWRVVQELAYVLNELSIFERLPTTFKPVSPPPYLNGGPEDYLRWVIECSDKNFRPGTVMKWLESRLPNPVDDPTQWEPS